MGKEFVNTLKEEEQVEQTVKHYIGWLRDMKYKVGIPNYEDDNGEDKVAVMVDIDGVPFDIAHKIETIMQMSNEHFKVIAKQLGKKVWE